MPQIRNENIEVFSTLLKAGTDINVQETKNGWTALMIACRGNQNLMVITTLLRAGADARLLDGAGTTASDYAKFNAKLIGTDAYKQLQEASR